MKISPMLGSFWLFNGVSTIICALTHWKVYASQVSVLKYNLARSNLHRLKQPNSVKEFALYFARIIEKGFVYEGGGKRLLCTLG